MNNALINAIYLATEGEGARLGTPQIFVRFQGCLIGCVNCDSKETWDFDDQYLMSMSEVISEIKRVGNKKYPIKTVSITGGDPLHPKHVPHVLELISRLKREDYFINIEASGSRIVPEIFDIIDYISFDFKTPSTEVKTNPNLIIKLMNQYSGKFQVKSVVADKKDYETSFDTYQYAKSHSKNELPWYVTPCFEPGEEFPKERFTSIIQMNEEYGAPFRVVGQQHKWLHGADQKQI